MFIKSKLLFSNKFSTFNKSFMKLSFEKLETETELRITTKQLKTNACNNKFCYVRCFWGSIAAWAHAFCRNAFLTATAAEPKCIHQRQCHHQIPKWKQIDARSPAENSIPKPICTGIPPPLDGHRSRIVPAVPVGQRTDQPHLRAPNAGGNHRTSARYVGHSGLFTEHSLEWNLFHGFRINVLDFQRRGLRQHLQRMRNEGQADVHHLQRVPASG